MGCWSCPSLVFCESGPRRLPYRVRSCVCGPQPCPGHPESGSRGAPTQLLLTPSLKGWAPRPMRRVPECLPCGKPSGPRVGKTCTLAWLQSRPAWALTCPRCASWAVSQAPCSGELHTWLAALLSPSINSFIFKFLRIDLREKETDHLPLHSLICVCIRHGLLCVP